MIYNYRIYGVLFRIDPDSPEPLHAQVAACVRRAVIDGSLTEGDRIPAARNLSTSLGVNMHTVLRGYATLLRDRTGGSGREKARKPEKQR